jgi:hypothetical protein
MTILTTEINGEKFAYIQRLGVWVDKYNQIVFSAKKNAELSANALANDGLNVTISESTLLMVNNKLDKLKTKSGEVSDTLNEENHEDDVIVDSLAEMKEKAKAFVKRKDASSTKKKSDKQKSDKLKIKLF